MHGGQIVEYALQFILLDAVADHDELLEEQQNVGPYGQYILLSRSRTICKEEPREGNPFQLTQLLLSLTHSESKLTQTLWYYAALGTRIYNPIVILERMYCL